MDVDLSTDLAALAPLVAPLISGHSDLAIGTRLGRGARVRARPETRDHLPLLQPDPEIHAVRRLLRRAVRVQGDPRRRRRPAAAVRRRHRMVLRHRAAGAGRAQRAAYPRGPGGLGRRSRQPRRHRRHGRRRPQRHRPAAARPRHRRDTGQYDRRAARLVAGTQPHPGHCCARWSDSAPSGWHRPPPTCCCSCAAGVGGRTAGEPDRVAVTAIANTAANRRFTFGIGGSPQLARHHLEGLIVFGIALSITSGALGLLHATAQTPAPHGRARCAGGGQPARDHGAIRPATRLGVPPPAHEN